MGSWFHGTKQSSKYKHVELCTGLTIPPNLLTYGYVEQKGIARFHNPHMFFFSMVAHDSPLHLTFREVDQQCPIVLQDITLASPTT